MRYLRFQLFTALLGALALTLFVVYLPTLVKLIDGPWQSEQEGHGPLIIAGACWLAWSTRAKLAEATFSSAPVSGWLLLLAGLATLFLARIIDFLPAEALSALPVLAGCILLCTGWNVFRMVAFPIGFLIFAVPVPDTIMVAITGPLKVLISDAVTEVLYQLDYPVSQNGVIIMISTYQLLVKDACSGINSVFALSAIGVFYAHVFRQQEKIRSLLLLAAIVPITIAANFIRVLALVLIAYYAGPDLLEGVVHDLTGIGLFIVAVVLMLLFDGLLGLAGSLLAPLSQKPMSGAVQQNGLGQAIGG